MRPNFFFVKSKVFVILYRKNPEFSIRKKLKASLKVTKLSIMRLVMIKGQGSQGFSQSKTI